MLRVAALLALTGCSAVLVRAPRVYETPTGAVVECRDSNVIPLVDTVITAASIAGAVYFVTDDKKPGDVGMPPGVFLTMTAIGYGISALYGFWRTSGCRDTKADYSALSGVNRSKVGMTFLPVTMPM